MNRRSTEYHAEHARVQIFFDGFLCADTAADLRQQAACPYNLPYGFQIRGTAVLRPLQVYDMEVFRARRSKAARDLRRIFTVYRFLREIAFHKTHRRAANQIYSRK